MSNDISDTNALIIKPTSIEINNQTNGIIHQNGNHSPSKSLKLKIGNENGHETMKSTNGHHEPQTNSNDHIYEVPSNSDSRVSTPSEVPTHSSLDEQNNKNLTHSHTSSTISNNEPCLNNGHDSGLSSDLTNATNSGNEMEKVILDDELSSTSGLTSSILSAARLLEVNQPREASPTSGVVIPEEKRVTDRVKVFEAVANNDQSTLKKQNVKNGNQKKSSSNDTKQNNKREQQVSPSSSSSTTTTESVDNQLTNELKSSSSTTPTPTPTTTTTKNKSKRPSLKKQIQNLLKIDKAPSQEESTILEEQQPAITNGKKSNTLNATRNKRENGKRTSEHFLLCSFY